MNGNQMKTTFQYTYSAREQEEIKRIRNKYEPREEDKMALLRRLDNRVNQKAAMYSIIIGVIGALIFGVGMCCCLLWAERFFIPGIIVGVIGMAAVALAYPVYERTLKMERQRIAPEILRLTEELMK